MPNEPRELRFKIHGLDCAEEVAVLKRELAPIVGGVDRLAFDILNGKMTVSVTTGVTTETIQSAVAGTGMRADAWSDSPQQPAESPWHRLHQPILTAVSGLATLAGFLLHVWISGGVREAFGAEGLGTAHHVPAAVRVLYAVGILAGVWQVLPKSWLALRRFRPDMNLLMTVAVIGAVAIGEWFEAATVSFLFALSLALEAWSVGRARRAVAALMNLAPPTVRLRFPDGREQETAPEQVAVGSTFVVRPGERIALDGQVVRGAGSVNQAPITGESVPVPKNPGDVVFAGTINGDSVLEVASTKPAGDTTLANIIRMVGEAQVRRAPSEQWVEKFAQIYTPAVMALAIAFLLVPPLFLGGAWSDWVYRALVLLVIACPCALVISTPVSIVAALAAAARNGVLVKGGRYIEEPAHLQAIAFDKTGTLTEGKPSVVAVQPLNLHSESELLERAASLESRSDHPLARAIVEYAHRRGVEFRPAEDFQVFQGKGATARFDGRQFWLGSHRYLEERGQETEAVHQQLEVLTLDGRTAVVIGNESHVCGFVTLADAVRDNARAAIDDLRRSGIRHLVMLTGDNEATARAIARLVGVDEFRAELLPADKVAAVEALVARYGHVGMVGDGINDAPALASASVGIAMGAAGSDAAIETADIALMADDLAKLAWLIRHSRRTLAVIRLNIFFALAVKALFVALTLAGHASLWAAIAADTGASLLVIFNALRLLRIR
jgi:Zn2+/Cd2+-exporting ATPase